MYIGDVLGTLYSGFFHLVKNTQWNKTVKMKFFTRVKQYFKTGWRVPGFLNFFLSTRSVCVRVSAPQAIKNHSREMKPE